MNYKFIDEKGQFIKGYKYTPEMRAARSEQLKRAYKEGRKIPSEIARLKTIERNKSIKQREAVKRAQTGKKHTKETKLKLSLATQKHWADDPMFRQIVTNAQLGRKQSEETIAKRIPQLSGANNYNWKGGITPLVRKIRNCWKMTKWKRGCLKRDNYKCPCGEEKGLCVDHIRPFSFIMADNNIRIFEEAMNCEELWDTNNGRTLCQDCHTELQNPYHRVYKEHE